MKGEFRFGYVYCWVLFYVLRVCLCFQMARQDRLRANVSGVSAGRLLSAPRPRARAIAFPSPCRANTTRPARHLAVGVRDRDQTDMTDGRRQIRQDGEVKWSNACVVNTGDRTARRMISRKTLTLVLDIGISVEQFHETYSLHL